MIRGVTLTQADAMHWLCRVSGNPRSLPVDVVWKNKKFQLDAYPAFMAIECGKYSVSGYLTKQL